MHEPREPRSLIQAAEQAAAAGNYASAEELLREAARLQEATLGPIHPDLANTLNNLGIVCEITDKPIDAERCFRRALTIATTVLEPDDPCVVTSRDNLRQFCEARGKQVELPPEPAQPVPPAAPAPEVTPPLEEAPATSSVAPTRELQLYREPQDLRPFLWKVSFGAVVVASAGPVAMLLVILTMGRPGLGSTPRIERPSPARNMAQAVPTPSAPSPVEPKPSPPKETAKAVEPAAPARPNDDAPAEASPQTRPTVVRAQLCADLDEWRCDPPDRPVAPGTLFFYTQVRSARPTTIQHRWYRDSHLQRSVELRVQASPGAGYRTYSRNTVNTQGVGNWIVELRTEDGAVLHEERFSVR